MSKEVETLLKETKAALESVGSDVKIVAENALKEAKNAGTLSQETKDATDKVLTNYHGLSDTVTKLTEKMEVLETSNLDMAQQIMAHEKTGPVSVQTLGQLIATNQDISGYAKNGARGTVKVDVENAITSGSGSAGGLIAPQRENEIVGLPRRRLAIRQLLMQGTTTSNLVEYARQTTRTNAAAPVAEEGTKPTSAYAWEKADATVRTVAHVINISRQALDDAGQLETLIDGEMRYGLDEEEDAQLYAGDGTGENLPGLTSVATAFSAAAGLPNATHIDRLRLGLLQVALTNYAADGIILSPTDWAAIELIKDTTGRYIYGNPNTQATPMLWGLNVVATQSATTGEWMTGAFQLAGTVYDRMLTEVLISSEHGDNFVQNMLTMRAEKRLALAIKRPTALVAGDFTFA